MNDIAGKLCFGCSACICACPQKCIQMLENSEGFLYPVIDEKKCVNCGLCRRVCPALSDVKNNEHNLNEVYAAVSKDPSVLMKSSSGGIFTELAKQVIMEKGCVLGASFSDDFRSVHHTMAESDAMLGNLRGSKYMQSVVGGVYPEIKKQLEAGRTVLFSGTPCQVAGLKSYLNKDYEHLFTVDIICHGVPSAKLWGCYLADIEKKTRGKAKYVSFRYKVNDTTRLETKRLATDGKIYYKAYSEDPFLKMFLKNDCLRESCYDCKAKENGTMADITIGDFWGIGKIKTNFDCSDGVSIIIVHTEKGKRLLKRAQPCLNIQPVDYTSAVAGNSALNMSSVRPAERDEFFVDLRRLKWHELEKKYAGEKLHTVLRRKLRSSFIGSIKRKITGRGSNDQKEALQFGVFVVCSKL